MVLGIPTAKIACKRVFLQGQNPKVGVKTPISGVWGFCRIPFLLSLCHANLVDNTLLGHLPCSAGDDSFVVGIRFLGVDVCRLNVSARIVGGEILCPTNLLFEFVAGSVTRGIPCRSRFGDDLPVFVRHKYIFRSRSIS